MFIREEVINEANLTKLDHYSSSCSPCQLLQSSKWLKFQESAGHKAHLFFIEVIDTYFTAFEYSLPLNKKYYYIPRGPVINNEKLQKEFEKEFKKILSKDIIFVRFEPNWIPASARKINDLQPSHTFYTDLLLDEKTLLDGMHQKTRYNIRLALKKEMSFLYNDPDIDSFIKLIKETSARDKFVSHPISYYKKMIESGAAQLATLKDNEEVLAAGIFAQYGDTMTYLHGASSSNKRELMAPYALHWEMMMFAKGEGLKHYDWHGVDDKKWPGFTRFKRGFGGTDIIYPGTFDLVLDSIAYTGYTVIRALVRLF